jgi:hypothetical protein
LAGAPHPQPLGFTKRPKAPAAGTPNKRHGAAQRPKVSVVAVSTAQHSSAPKSLVLAAQHALDAAGLAAPIGPVILRRITRKQNVLSMAPARRFDSRRMRVLQYAIQETDIGVNCCPLARTSESLCIIKHLVHETSNFLKLSCGNRPRRGFLEPLAPHSQYSIHVGRKRHCNALKVCGLSHAPNLFSDCS